MTKRMALLITKATPEAAYASWMMAATAAAMATMVSSGTFCALSS